MSTPDRAETQAPARSEGRRRRVNYMAPGYFETRRATGIDPLIVNAAIKRELAEYRELVTTASPESEPMP